MKFFIQLLGKITILYTILNLNLEASMNDFLVIGNNEAENFELQKLIFGRTVIALDGAANRLHAIGIDPDIIFGDLDAISKRVLNFYQNKKVKIVHRPNQDYTDLEKCIFFCDQLQSSSIILTNVLAGKRTDHTLTAFSSLKRYHKLGRKLRIISNDVIEFICDQEMNYFGEIEQKFSVFGFPQACVWSDGLKWELKNTHCVLGQNNSLCNEFIKNKVSLRVKGEAIITYPFLLSSFTKIKSNM